MVQVISNIPLWVYPLFLGLAWIGLRSTRDRVAPTSLFMALPLLGLMGLNRAVTLPQASIAIACLVGALVAGGVLGFRLQQRWIIAVDGRRVRLRGEWLTLASMAGIFSLSFAAGMLQGMGSELVATATFAAIFGTGCGVVTGLFVGRGLRITLAAR